MSPDANGLLDLSRSTHALGQLERLSASEKALVDTIDLSYCELSGVLPDLSGFTNLKKLVASNNQLTGFGNLPVSLEEIHINNNLFSHEPINALLALTHLRILDARFNQLNQFPTNIYRTLEANRQTGAKLELIGNRFTELPDFVLNSAVEVTLDNHPGLLASVRSNPLETSVSFEDTFPNEILEGQLYLGAIEHLEASVLHTLGIRYVVSCPNDVEVKKKTAVLTQQGFSVADLNMNDADGEEADLKEKALRVHQAIQA